MENAPGLRTAAPSSADRGMAEAEAPVPGTVRSRRPNVSDTPLPGTSVSQAPHVPDTPRLGHPSPGTPGSSAEGTGGGRAEGHLPTRARGTTGSTRAPAEPPSKPPPGGAPAAASAPAPTEARAPLQGRGRRRLTFLGGVHLVWGAAVTQPRRRPRPGRALGPRGGEGGRGTDRGGGRGRGPGRCVRSGARGSRTAGDGVDGQRLTESERRGGGGARGRKTGLGGARGGKGGAPGLQASLPARALGSFAARGGGGCGGGGRGGGERSCWRELRGTGAWTPRQRLVDVWRVSRDKGAREPPGRARQPGAPPSGRTGRRSLALGTRPRLPGLAAWAPEQAFWFLTSVAPALGLKGVRKHP